MKRVKNWTSKDIEGLPDHIKRQLGTIQKSNKYHAERAKANKDWFPELAGRSFASKLERDRAKQLLLLQHAGEIKDLSFQPQVYLTRAKCGYKLDFLYRERTGPWRFRWIYEEVKGVDGYPWLTNKKLWTVYGPGILRIVKAGPHGPRVDKEIFPTG